MRDFTLDIYRELLEAFLQKGYELVSYSDYCRNIDKSTNRNTEGKFVILRHDVDAKPQNSLRTAQIEHSLGARASYYFRTGESGCYKKSPVSLPESVRAIVQLGHEAGYHYEDMSLCQGDTGKAWAHFLAWVDYFRRFYAMETICMHGAPTSQWDSKALWQHYDYRTAGIIGEPYMDTDFSDVFYLTDTGRCWDGFKVSVRDKIPGYQDRWIEQGLVFHSTADLLQALAADRLPRHIMMTTHPQRWSNDTWEWTSEFVLQHCKNVIKRMLVR